MEMIYKYVIPTPKAQCSKSKQLGVSFAAGYVAGVLCAIVSHPADNLVSFLNNAKGATVGDVSLCMHSYIHHVMFMCVMLAYLSLFPNEFAGSEEDWSSWSFHSRPSSSYSYDWNTNRSSVGSL